MKIAIATKDGISVNQHFGKAQTFEIYELINGSFEHAEQRKVDAYCDSLIAPNKEHPFNQEKFEAIYKTLKDCSAIYAQQIGDTPFKKLMAKGITPITYQGEINQLLQEELN